VSRLRFCGAVSSPVMVSIVLCGRETLSVILKEELKLRVFEVRVLRKVFESMKDDVTRDWRGLRNEELHIIRVNKLSKI
jgi:hypothetical protein